MSRTLALVLTLLAAPAWAAGSDSKPAEKADSASKDKPAQKAPAADKCPKMVDHMWELAKTDMTAKLEEKDRAAALAEADKKFKAERDGWVAECSKDPTVTEASAKCVLGATSADQIDKCMEPSK